MFRVLKVFPHTVEPKIIYGFVVRIMANYSTDKLFVDKRQTQLYAKFRPTYTEQIFQRIIDYCREGDCDFDLAVDIGCGSGQSTLPLSKHFKKVIGVDVSEQQIANAPTNVPNVSYRVSLADELVFLEKETADLVTVAQAFHWLDQDRFFKEINRVLKPGGSLVVYGYGTNKLVPDEADKYFQHIYNNVLSNYWAEGRRMVEEKYSSVSLPFPGWIRDDGMAIEKECSIADYVGYLGSMSAVQNYKQENPNHKLLEEIEERFCSALKASGDEKLKVIYPVFMLLGRKPKM